MITSSPDGRAENSRVWPRTRSVWSAPCAGNSVEFSSRCDSRTTRAALVALRLFTFLLCFFVFTPGLSAAIPSVEKLLPDDTLFLITVPDYPRFRAIFEQSAQ